MPHFTFWYLFRKFEWISHITAIFYAELRLAEICEQKRYKTNQIKDKKSHRSYLVLNTQFGNLALQIKQLIQRQD